MEENNCGPYMFGKIFLVAMRAKLRGQHGIKVWLFGFQSVGQIGRSNVLEIFDEYG